MGIISETFATELRCVTAFGHTVVTPIEEIDDELNFDEKAVFEIVMEQCKRGQSGPVVMYGLFIRPKDQPGATPICVHSHACSVVPLKMVGALAGIDPNGLRGLIAEVTGCECDECKEVRGEKVERCDDDDDFRIEL